MLNFAWILFMIFLLFQGALSSQLIMPSFYGYWDEIFWMLLLALYIYSECNESLHRRKIVYKKNIARLIMPWVAVVVVGLLGNVSFHYVSSPAIIRDVIGFLKFPMTFYAIRGLGLDEKIAKAMRSNGLVIMKVITIMIFIFGVLSLRYDLGMTQEGLRHGISPYQFVFNHPTALVSTSVMILCLFCADEHRKNYFAYNIMLILIIVLSMRTKGLAFIAVYIFMRYSHSWLRKYKIIYWMAIFALVVAASYSKLQLYMSWSSSGREILWRGAFTLLIMCFPIGSGFGTYASHVSGRFRSQVYNFINHYDLWRSDGTASAVMGDTGFPYYIGQFGFVGMIFLVIAVWRMIGLWHSKSNRKLHRGLAEDLLLMYLAIALTSESILITYGFEYAVVLAVLLRLDEMKEKESADCNGS